MLTRERLYKDIFYMGISKEQFYDIKQEVIEDNRQTVCRGSICTAVFWTLSLMLTRESEVFLACVVVFAAGIGIACFQPDVRTASMIAFADYCPNACYKKYDYRCCDGEEELKSIALEQPKNFSIVMLDLNGLKKANDTFGHDAGDELIKATAKCLRESFVKEERIYRIGGDEFSVIHLGHEDEIQHCFRILDQKAADWNGKYIHGFTISYGVASRDIERDVQSVVKLADQKMYECKRNYYKTYA